MAQVIAILVTFLSGREAVRGMMWRILLLTALPAAFRACDNYENETMAASLRILDGACDRIRIGLDCKDDDLSNGTKNGIHTADDCCALCAADSRCKAWTVYPERKVCFLKSGCSNPIKSDGTSGGSTMPPAPSPTPSGPCKPDTWEILPDMPVKMGEVFATVVDGRIVIAGEEHDQEDFPTLEYDIARGAWSKHAKRIYPGNHHTAELVDGQVMLFGGFDSGLQWPDISRTMNKYRQLLSNLSTNELV